MFVLDIASPTITFTSNLGDLILAIVGIVAGIVGIIISVLIYVRTGKIQKKQVENAEGSYSTNTEKNMKEIHEYFNSVIRITKESMSKEDTEQRLATDELNLYFHTNYGEMRKLLQRSIDDLKSWGNLDRNKRDQFDEIIKDFSWLLEKFFPPTELDDDMKTKIWTSEYLHLLEKKYNIEKILEDNLKPSA